MISIQNVGKTTQKGLLVHLIVNCLDSTSNVSNVANLQIWVMLCKTNIIQGQCKADEE